MADIHIQFTLFSAFYTPLIVTMSGGFLRDESIDYEWSVAPPGVSAIAAIEAGTAQVIQSAPSQGLTALQAGKKPSVLHFAQVNEMDGFFITAREPDNDFDWKKLEGSEVVLFAGGQPNIMFRYACHIAGIDYTKIKQITPGGAQPIDKAFRDGQGQYVVQQGPFPQQLEEEKLGSVVARVGPQIGPCAFSSLAATPQWLSTDAAPGFIRAYKKARIFLNEHNANEIFQSISSYFPDTEPQALIECIQSYQALGCWTPHVEITPEAFEVTQDVFKYVNAIDRRFSYAEVCCPPPE